MALTPVASVTSANANVTANQAVALSTLMSASDADGDAITQYQLYDDGADGGYFSITGEKQPGQGGIPVSAAEFANTRYVGGSAAGSEMLWAQAHDGAEWGPWKSWNMTTLAS